MYCVNILVMLLLNAFMLCSAPLVFVRHVIFVLQYRGHVTLLALTLMVREHKLVAK